MGERRKLSFFFEPIFISSIALAVHFDEPLESKISSLPMVILHGYEILVKNTGLTFGKCWWLFIGGLLLFILKIDINNLFNAGLDDWLRFIFIYYLVIGIKRYGLSYYTFDMRLRSYELDSGGCHRLVVIPQFRKCFTYALVLRILVRVKWTHLL